MNDQDIIDATRSSGVELSDGSRIAMRSMLETAIRGEQMADVVPIHSATRTRRPARWWAAGAVAAVAAAAAIVVVTTDDGATHVTPATVDTVTEPDDSLAPIVAPIVTPSLPPAVTLDQLTGHRWIVTDTVTDNVAKRWPSAILPYAEFSTGETIVTGSDGCNDYSASGLLDDGSLRIPVGGSTAVLCTGIPDGALHDGDHLVLSPDDGITLLVNTAAGDPRLRLVQADALALAPDLDGAYITGPHSVLAVDFVQSGLPVVVGECPVWSFVNGVLIRDDASLQTLTQGPCVRNDSLGRDDAELFDELTTGSPMSVVHSNESDDIFLLGDGSPIRLMATDPGVSADHINIDRASVLGLIDGRMMEPDQVANDLQPTLGPVDHDTGWYTTPVVTYADGTDDCLGGKEYRVLWWGDLSLAFWRQPEGVQLWSWSVGDRQASGWGDRREPYAPTNPTPTGITTDEGIQVGSTEAEMVAVYGDHFHPLGPAEADGTQRYISFGNQILGHRGLGAGITVLDGVVTGIGSARQFC
jgi:hypothetical protein